MDPKGALTELGELYTSLPRAPTVVVAVGEEGARE